MGKIAFVSLTVAVVAALLGERIFTLRWQRFIVWVMYHLLSPPALTELLCVSKNMAGKGSSPPGSSSRITSPTVSLSKIWVSDAELNKVKK